MINEKRLELFSDTFAHKPASSSGVRNTPNVHEDPTSFDLMGQEPFQDQTRHTSR
jgi:hypothetical protein